MKKDLLVVVDMQNDFIDGSLGTPEAQTIVPNVVNKIKNWDGDIIVTKDTHTTDYLSTHEGKNLPIKHCIMFSHGWQINESVQNALNEKKFVVDLIKNSFGLSLQSSALINYDSITLIGLCTDICVISNALIFRRDYPEKDIYVDSSCCAGVTPAKHEAALEVMRSCQIEVY